MSDWLTKCRECPQCVVMLTYIQPCEAHSMRVAFTSSGTLSVTGLPPYTEGAHDPCRFDVLEGE